MMMFSYTHIYEEKDKREKIHVEEMRCFLINGKVRERDG